MNLTLLRTHYLPDRTLGILLLDNRPLCHTLELPLEARASSPATSPIAPTAIPCGTYPLRITYSPRFKTPLPLVDNVPNRTGIRLHAGNTPRDTKGCILVGVLTDDPIPSLAHSRKTLNRLLQILSPNETHYLHIQ